jgi:uncharacterized membrane protein
MPPSTHLAREFAVDAIVTVATIVVAVASASIGGVFLAFSTFVMAGLGRLAAPNGIRAMQSINVTAVTPVFMAVLFGTAVLSIFLAVVSLVDSSSGTAWSVGAAALYIGGVIAVTAAFHVPRNNALARVSADDAQGAAFWNAYRVAWVRGNHVRMLCALASSALWVVSILPAG